MAVGAAVVFFFVGWYLRILGRKELKEDLRKEVPAASPVSPAFGSSNPEMRRLQLQAYERLIILCERLALPSLLGRFPVAEMSAAELKASLVQTIKTEFEYNLSQQLYVSPAAWDGIKNLKEQQIFILNQLGAMLPPGAGGSVFAKQVAELLMHDENATLQPIIAALLTKEARQLMQ